MLPSSVLSSLCMYNMKLKNSSEYMKTCSHNKIYCDKAKDVLLSLVFTCDGVGVRVGFC